VELESGRDDEEDERDEDSIEDEIILEDREEDNKEVDTTSLLDSIGSLVVLGRTSEGVDNVGRASPWLELVNKKAGEEGGEEEEDWVRCMGEDTGTGIASELVVGSGSGVGGAVPTAFILIGVVLVCW